MTDTRQELYACLYIEDFPAQALLRLRPGKRNEVVVVVNGDQPVEQVCSLNRKALEAGIAHGMTRAEVDTFPFVTYLVKSATEEATSRQVLFECSAQFSPRVEDRSTYRNFLCVIDISGTEQLFGPPLDLARKLSSQVNTFGFQASIAISSNVEATICLVRNTALNNVTIVLPGKQTAALAPIPITVLNLTEQDAETFASWGIYTLGMLAAISEEALICRLGQAGKRLRLLARGEMPHHFNPIEPAFTLKEHIDIEPPIEILDSLLFVISLMLEQLILRANSYIFALASVTVTLHLEGSGIHTRTARTASPCSDRKVWLTLIHLDLAAHPPCKPINALSITAEAGSSGKVQLGLFSPQLPEPMQLDITLARIKRIVGENCAGSAVLEDNHEQDSFHLVPFNLTHKAASAKRYALTKTAARKLRPPANLPITLSDCHPAHFCYEQKDFTVERAYGPWQGNGEWWSPRKWSHEQWDVVSRASDNTLLCCCLEHDPSQQTWQMTAIYD